MADIEASDVNITGGVNGDSLEFDNFSSDDQPLKDRIEELEREKRELSKEKDAMKAALEKLEEEKEAAGKKIQAAEVERDQLEMKAMESITKRAFELEGEVVRLQHDLGSAMNAGDEASREVVRLMREIEELKIEKSAQISDLEKKIEALEESEREARKQAAIAEEKAKARLDELQSEIVQVKKEKSAVEDIMASVNSELRDSEKKVIEMGKRIQQLAENTQASGEILAEMVEKAAKRDAGFGGLKNKVSMPVAGAVAAGIVVAALAVCHVKFSRSR